MQIIVDGIETEYIDSGAGSTVLFLHGWGASASSFDLLINELGSNKRYVSLSLPGFGHTENPPEPWNVADYAQFVEHFLLKLDITQPDLIIAHSFGGRVAIKGIASGLLLPKQLVLIASAGVARRSIKRRAIAAIISIGKLITLIPPVIFIRPWIRSHIESSDYQNAGELRETFKKVIAENLEVDAKRIRLPTLLIWGDSDTQTPISEGYTLLGCIEKSRIKIIPGASHFVLKENVKQVAKLIHKFYA